MQNNSSDYSKEKIINSQIIYIVIASIGLGFIYPTDQIAKLGYSWLAVIFLCTVIAVLQAALLSYLPGKFPGKTIHDYSESIMGRLPAKIIGFIIFVHFTLSTAIQVRIFSNVIKLYLLNTTPREVVIIAITAAVIYTAIGGMGNILRATRFFVKIAIIGLILLIAAAMLSKDYTATTFAFNLDPKDLFFSIPNAMMLFGGIETVLITSAFARQHNKLAKNIIYAVLITGTLIIITEFVLLVRFGVGALQHIRYPILYLAGSISLNSTVTQRFDLIFIFSWIILAFSTISICYYNSSFSLTHLLGTKCIYPSVLAVAPIVTSIALFPKSVGEQSLLFHTNIFTALVTGVIIPIVLIIFYRLKGIFRNSREISSKALLLAAVMLLPFTLSGCWDSSQINEQSFIIGIGIDKSLKKEGSYDITYQTLVTTPSEGSLGKMDYSTLTVTADNFQSAQQQLLSINDEAINLDHNKIFIISHDVAQDGVREFLYYFFDNINISQNMQFCISSVQAREIMNAYIENDKVPCYYIWDIIAINGKKSPEIITSGNIKNLKQDFFENNIMIMPYIEYAENSQSIEQFHADSSGKDDSNDSSDEKPENVNKSIKLNKSAVVYHGKLACVLDSDMTTSLKIIKNQMNTAQIPLSVSSEEKKIFLNLQNIKVKRVFSDTSDIANTPPKLELVVTGEGYINTVINNVNTDILQESEMLKIKEQINYEVTKYCSEILDFARNNLKIDIFSFKDHLPVMSMKTLRVVNENWNNLFSNMDITITPVINISQFGLTH